MPLCADSHAVAASRPTGPSRASASHTVSANRWSGASVRSAWRYSARSASRSKYPLNAYPCEAEARLARSVELPRQGGVQRHRRSARPGRRPPSAGARPSRRTVICTLTQLRPGEGIGDADRRVRGSSPSIRTRAWRSSATVRCVPSSNSAAADGGVGGRGCPGRGRRADAGAARRRRVRAPVVGGVVSSTWILEAMSVGGLAIAASDVGGVGEAITDGDTGLLFAARDADATAAALLALLADGGLRRALGRPRTRGRGTCSARTRWSTASLGYMRKLFAAIGRRRLAFAAALVAIAGGIAAAALATHHGPSRTTASVALRPPAQPAAPARTAPSHDAARHPLRQRPATNSEAPPAGTNDTEAHLPIAARRRAATAAPTRDPAVQCARSRFRRRRSRTSRTSSRPAARTATPAPARSGPGARSPASTGHTSRRATGCCSRAGSGSPTRRSSPPARARAALRSCSPPTARAKPRSPRASTSSTAEG